MQQVKIMPAEGVVFWQQGQETTRFPQACDSQACLAQAIEQGYS